jgi:fructokinase
VKPVGGIEAGGTKFICAVGTGPDDVEVSKAIPTRGPEETLRDVVSFFAGRKLKRIGIGSFGPVDLKSGAITKTTPKLDWRSVPIRSILEQALGVKAVLDTDVNAAALGEHRWGAARGIDNFVYITVGTGIGGGAIVNGRLVHGLLHPEMGHLRVPGNGSGSCPYHPDCLEGYASGSAIARFGPAEAARHLAAGLTAITSVISPEMIILGGGVMNMPGLLAGIRQELKKEVYVPMPKLVRPKLGDRAGVLGAIVLAQTKF